MPLNDEDRRALVADIRRVREATYYESPDGIAECGFTPCGDGEFTFGSRLIRGHPKEDQRNPWRFNEMPVGGKLDVLDTYINWSDYRERGLAAQEERGLLFEASRDEGRPLLVGPFAVEQLIHRARRRRPGAPQQPGADRQSEQRVGQRETGVLVEHQRGDHRKIEQQVGLVMDVIGADRDRAGARDHHALPGEQCEGGDHRDQRDCNPFLCARGRAALDQPHRGAKDDRRGRQRDQHHLHHRCQRLGLAVPEAMLAVGGLRGEPHPDQRREAGNQIERRISEAAEHRGRAGAPARPGLERDQQYRHRDRGEGGGAGER